MDDMLRPVRTTTRTALGDLTLVRRGDALAGVYFPHHRPSPPPAALGEQAGEDDLVLRAAIRQLQEYLAGDRHRFDLPVTRRGDPFQEQVWAALDDVPYGSTTTYGELAARLGEAALAQQVGRALATNPLSVVVPCHRVVGAGGRLVGYAGGLPRKQRLLELEALGVRAPDRLF